MSFDKRIKNPKRDILCYLDVVSTTDAYKESLIGKRGFFANTLQEFAYLRDCHFKKLARIDLDADSEDYTVKFINEECFINYMKKVLNFTNKINIISMFINSTDNGKIEVLLNINEDII